MKTLPLAILTVALLSGLALALPIGIIHHPNPTPVQSINTTLTSVVLNVSNTTLQGYILPLPQSQLSPPIVLFNGSVEFNNHTFPSGALNLSVTPSYSTRTVMWTSVNGTEVIYSYLNSTSTGAVYNVTFVTNGSVQLASLSSPSGDINADALSVSQPLPPAPLPPAPIRPSAPVKVTR